MSRLSRYLMSLALAILALFSWHTYAQDGANANAEAPEPSVQMQHPAGPLGPPITITLTDAIARARKVDSPYLNVVGGAKNAHDDTLQSRNAMLPQASATSQFLGTTGNGKDAIGRFVTQDGVHVYRAWGVFRQDLSPNTYLATGYRRTKAAEALAKAKAEIARRGLTVTVTKNYYALVTAQRNLAATQQALDQAQNFFKITQDAEKAGQAAHADALRAQIQVEQEQQVFNESNLAMDDARLNLAVLLFPTLDENFTIVDDLDSPAPLPVFAEAEAMAMKDNPDLRVAMESAREADLDVSAAKGAFLPSFSIETDYGIEANAFALRSVNAEEPKLGPLPNLGYYIQAGVTIPVWDWGTLRSKLRQSETNREQARAELSQTQRETLANLYAAYNEASVARQAVESSRRVAADAAESLRLSELRYQGGESTALEVVDSQNVLTQARTTYDDAQMRYRVALATLQTFTGNF